MQAISNFIEQAKKELDAVIVSSYTRVPHYPDMTEKEFHDFLQAECNRFVVSRNIGKRFHIDKQAIEAVTYLYRYLTLNDFKGSPDRGLLVMGGIGVGKTVLIKGFASMVQRLSGKSFYVASAFEINNAVSERGTKGYVKVPMVIDDLGKEPELVNSYGTKTRPILQLFAERYEEGTLTYVTTNYDMDTLSKKYGEQTTDRFKEMFNIIKMLGASRRE
jgi:DNA replication protein DnaC